MISAASSAGEASMNLSGWNSASAASPSRSSRASAAVRPTSPVSIPAHLTSSSGRSKALAMAASSRPSRSPMRSSPLRTLTMYFAVSGSTTGRAGVEERRLARRPGGRLDRRERRGDLGERRARRRVAARGRPPSSTSADRQPEVGRAVVGRGAARRRSAPGHAQRPRRASADQPRPVARWSASGNGRPVRKTAAIGSSSGVRRAQVVGEDRRLLGRLSSSPRRARRARSSGAWRRWYTVSVDAPSTRGSRIISRAIASSCAGTSRENLRDFMRWYQDPEVARLTRYQDGADAARGDRALLHDAGRSAPTRWRWASTSATRTGSSGRARSASSTATTARRCSTSRSASATPGATATAPRRPG